MNDQVAYLTPDMAFDGFIQAVGEYTGNPRRGRALRAYFMSALSWADPLPPKTAAELRSAGIDVECATYGQAANAALAAMLKIEKAYQR